MNVAPTRILHTCGMCGAEFQAYDTFMNHFVAEAQRKRAEYEAHRKAYREWYVREHGHPDDVVVAKRF